VADSKKLFFYFGNYQSNRYFFVSGKNCMKMIERFKKSPATLLIIMEEVR